MFCSTCGTKIPDDSKFCYKCGNKVIIPVNGSDASIDENASVTSQVSELKDKMADAVTSDEKETQNTIQKEEKISIDSISMDQKINDDNVAKQQSSSTSYYSTFSTYDAAATNALLFTKEYWLLWRGRRGRKAAWITGMVLVVFNVILTGIMKEAIGKSSLMWFLWLLQLVVGYLAIINIGKRFHDLDMPGWYAVLFQIGVLGISIAAPGAATFLILIPSLWLTFAKGTDGENKYGPDPMAPRQ